ncbi:MAG: CPBP family intramembrane glutamic endopeptidase [Gammaproteobacteria bacterium]
MTKSETSSADFFKKACLFEASLVGVAAILGWIGGINPFDSLYLTESAIGRGILGTVPLFLLFIGLENINREPVLKIRRVLLETLGPLFHHLHWSRLFILAAIAGVSEEILFRGVLQPWMEASWGAAAGLFWSNLLFGLAHAVTPLYAVLASLVGIYLGLALDYGGERNLLVPIIIHGLYDFLAFILLMRAYRASRKERFRD